MGGSGSTLKDVRVVIIGGNFAGMSSVRALLKAGLKNITVIEVRLFGVRRERRKEREAAAAQPRRCSIQGVRRAFSPRPALILLLLPELDARKGAAPNALASVRASLLRNMRSERNRPCSRFSELVTAEARRCCIADAP